MAHAIPHPERPQLDYNRIAGNAGAIAVNAALLMLLLVPLNMPTQEPPPIRDQLDFTWIPREKVVPPPIVEREIRKDPKPNPAPVQTPVRIETPPAPVVDSIETDNIYVPPEAQPQPEVFASNTLGRGEILTGVTLQVVNNPPPSYPGEAVRNNLTGTVMLEILVGIDGKPVEVTVVKSSGHRVLDQAARRVVMSRWTFQPAMEDGQPVQARGRVPIEFTLER